MNNQTFINSPAKESAARDIVRIGVAGLGAAGRAFLPAISTHSGFRLVAVAEPTELTRAEIAGRDGIAGYRSLVEMLSHPQLDAVYIGTPTNLHPEHATAAMAAGKHVLVEKPMAIRLSQAQGMIDCAAKAGVVLLVGHSHSYDMPIHGMREIITSGRLGRVCMVNTWNYTDWIYRPRRPDELDIDQGGGALYRQGSHQFDIIRYLCGGKAKSVRGKTFDMDPDRQSVGAHIVYIDFEDGPAATAVYNGYGGFSTTELCFNMTEWGFADQQKDRKPVRRTRVVSTPEEELEAKRVRSKNAIPSAAPFQPFFGLTLVSCEHGDMRQSPEGLFLYTEEGCTRIDLATDRSPRDLVMTEFFNAITGRMPAIHDGHWGLANLEICVAALESSKTNREIYLCHQVGLPASIFGR